MCRSEGKSERFRPDRGGRGHQAGRGGELQPDRPLAKGATPEDQKVVSASSDDGEGGGVLSSGDSAGASGAGRER